MSSRQRSPNSLSSGLRSTATTRSLHPRTKCHVRSRVSATARASPSTGAYLDSAMCVKRDPTSVFRHPSRQQNGSREGHWQCFWSSQKPIPSFDQSVAKHVGRLLSNIWTPLCIWSQMWIFDAWNASASWSVHLNGVEGFRRDLKGCIAAVIEKV